MTITLAPSAWKHVAVAAPIPVVPPVIRAILLLSLPVPSISAMPRPGAGAEVRVCLSNIHGHRTLLRQAIEHLLGTRSYGCWIELVVRRAADGSYAAVA